MGLLCAGAMVLCFTSNRYPRPARRLLVIYSLLGRLEAAEYAWVSVGKARWMVWA